MLAQKYLQALSTISRLAPLLDAQLEPARGNHTDAYKAPSLPRSKPPLSMTWLDLKLTIEEVLRTTCRQVRADTAGLYGKPVPTVAGMAGWLSNQHDHLAGCMWADSEVWWHMQTGVEGSSAAAETINHARLLEETLDPVVKHPPAGTAQQMCLATGVPADTIRNWRRAGKLPATKIGGRWIYRLTDIQKVGTPQCQTTTQP